MTIGVRSATAVPEKELVKWAFGRYGIAWHLVPWLLGGADCILDFEVGAPVLVPVDRQTDELDVLVWPAENPACSTVIEVKRARVDAGTIATEQVGGLANISDGEGVEQCEAHLTRGFHRVYLAVFVQVDAREFSGGYWQGGQLPTPLLQQIRAAVRSRVSNPAIGLLVFQPTQPVDKDVLLGGSIGLIDWRLAVPQQQANDLTSRIREFATDTSRNGRIEVRCSCRQDWTAPKPHSTTGAQSRQ